MPASFQEAQNLILRKPTEAPALNRSSPYAQGLVFCTPFWEGFKHNREIVDVAGVLPNLQWPVGADPDVSWIEDPRGPLLHFDQNNGTYANTQWSSGELTWRGDWTLLWAGKPLSFFSSASTYIGIANGVTGLLTFGQLSASETVFNFAPGGAARRIVLGDEGYAGKYQVVIGRNSEFGGLDVWRNGEFIGTDATFVAPPTEPIDLAINSVLFFGAHLLPVLADHHLAAWWNHAIPDNWIPRLTSDPWAMLRTDEEPEVLRYPIWKRLPCFDLRNRRVVLKPIDQTEVRDGQIQAASAARIRRERREVDLDLTLLSENEKTALLACWDNGAGLVRPFWMQLAGETEARRYVFKTPLFSIEHRGPSAKIAKARLIDVTRFE